MPLYSSNGFQPFWGNLWTPPLLFRRRPPQSNCPADNVRCRDQRTPLEPQQQKCGIPTLTPRKPKFSLPSLPHILCIYYRNSISTYSKALRGLSVQSQVICIFTYTTISPGLWLRQRPNRYAIHAGQNLPDKEFRYLRTVIVTAAVHWGLSSMLRCYPNISPWPSSTGQASAPILQLALLQRPVF